MQVHPKIGAEQGPEVLVAALLDALAPHGQAVPGLLQWLEQRLRFWSTRTWRVGLMGVTSAGKSTIINGFYRAPLLPARVKPSSNVLILSRHGDGPRAVIHYSDGKPSEEVRDRLAERLSAVGDEHLNPENRLAVQEIELWGPTFEVRPDVVVVDTPGLNAYSYDLHETLTLRTFLPTVDLVLFVITAKANSDAQVEKYLRDIAEAGKPVILVQNMIDTVQPKLGVGGLVVRTRLEVALEHKRRAQRIAKVALGLDDVPVHQVAAVRAVEGNAERSGLPELARAIEQEVARLAPALHAGRFAQVRAELARCLPAESAAEDAATLDQESEALRGHWEGIEASRRWLHGQLTKPGAELRVNGERLKARARQLGKHEVGTARAIQQNDLPAWSNGAARQLHAFATDMMNRTTQLARGLDLPLGDFHVPTPQGVGTKSVRVQAWDDSWVERRKSSGAWSAVKRFFGAGGYDEVHHAREAMDLDAFVDDVDGAVGASIAWFVEQRARLVEIGVGHLVRLEQEVGRRQATLDARRGVACTKLARAEARATMLTWIAAVDGYIAAANATAQASGAGSACAPLDEVRDFVVARPALDLLALADHVARHRFVAARDAVLGRAARRVDTALVVGWDRDAIDGFLSRFWFDAVEGGLEGHEAMVRLPRPLPDLRVVDESRLNFDYQSRIGAGVRTTQLFLLLDIEQPGATESTLARERHLLDVRFGSVCVVLQSLRGFRRSEGWAVGAVVEALVEAERILHEWKLAPIGVLANDDDIGFSALADQLLAGSELRTMAQEKELLGRMNGMVETGLAARILREWVDVRQRAAKGRVG